LVSLIFALLLIQAPPTIPAIPSPTPIPTSTPMGTLGAAFPSGQIYQFLSTAVANVNALPADVSRAGGVSVLPNENAASIFGYGKWMFSGASAEQLLGRTVAPLGIIVFASFTLVVVLASVYLLINVATLIVKGVTWIFQQILRVIPFIGLFMPLSQIPPTPTPYPPAPPVPISLPDTRIWDFAAEAIGWWNQIGSDRTQVFQEIIIVVIIVFSMLFIVGQVRSLSLEREKE
jgi:hypothetical protein